MLWMLLMLLLELLKLSHVRQRSRSSFILIDTAATVLFARTPRFLFHLARKIRIWNSAQSVYSSDDANTGTRFRLRCTPCKSNLFLFAVVHRASSVRPFPLGTLEVLS